MKSYGCWSQISLAHAVFQSLTTAVAAVALSTILTFQSHAGELVMFEQQGCEWCDVWNEEVGVVYHKTDEGRRFPLRRVDLFARRPADLKAIKPVVYTPTFVLVEHGQEVGRIVGFVSSDFFWGLLAKLIEKTKPPNQEAGLILKPATINRN